MKRIYKLEGLDCAHCAAKVEAAVAKIAGVQSVHVNFLTQKMTLECDETCLDAIEAQARIAAQKADGDIEMRRA